jgi:hypothetical protein
MELRARGTCTPEQDAPPSSGATGGDVAMPKSVMSVVGIVLALGGSAAYADPITASGVYVTGSGDHLYSLGSCSTCPNVGPSLSESAGGDNVQAASTQYLAGPFFWYASASLASGTYLPEVKAYAEAQPPPPDGQYDFWVNANSTAQARQRFIYEGLVSETYTLEYTVDGTLSGDFESVSAGLGVYGGNYVPNLEGEMQVTRKGSDQVWFSAETHSSFLHTGSITFSLDPGEAFYVTAFLTAQAFWTDATLGGAADASHTLTTAFTAGNTSLLTPVVSTSVPEPATGLLALAGMAGAAGARRRRRS